MNVAMWGKALQVIPRVDKKEWDELDFVARWLIATRFTVAVMTFISASIAGLLAYRDGAFDPLLWSLVTIGLLFAHASNNLINDLTDHAKGVDKGNYFRTQYGAHPLEHGLLTRAQMFKYIAVTFGIALAAGAYLVAIRGEATLTLFGLGIFFVLFYTWPLKYIGLGELAVIIVWGPLMVGGGYYVITGGINDNVILASLPFALAATTVLFGKHIDKLIMDEGKGIRTMPVLLGERNARYTTIGLLSGQYLLTGYLIASGYFSPLMALVVFALPGYLRAVKAHAYERPARRPKDFPDHIWPLWYSAFVFSHTRRFGILFLVGLILDVATRSFGLWG
jgi:1,4-dihydroxy-2-naphthoate octaprenyltransferase